MCAVRSVSRDQVRDQLARWAPSREQELDALFEELQPVFQLETEEERILFRTNHESRTITMGLKCSCRLQAHAYAAGIFLTALGTPGYLAMPPEERQALYAPADPILTWAVARDLQLWLRRDGIERDLEQIMKGSESELPGGLLSSLTPQQRLMGEGIFRIASAFIILHEIGHLRLGHSGAEGHISCQQEKDADRFAAEWLISCPGISESDRFNCLLGVSTALLWLTIHNIYLGPVQSRTHPEPYDRLFQTLDQFVDDDPDSDDQLIWDFLARTLLIHMDNAGVVIDWERMRGLSREQVSCLLDTLANQHRRC